MRNLHLLRCHEKSWLIGKDSDAGRDWGQEEKGTTEDEMAGWHHCLDGHEFEWTPGVGDGQGGLACCSSWGRKELDMTERLNWTELNTLAMTPIQARVVFCLVTTTFKKSKGRRLWKPLATISSLWFATILTISYCLTVAHSAWPLRRHLGLWHSGFLFLFNS